MYVLFLILTFFDKFQHLIAGVCTCLERGEGGMSKSILYIEISLRQSICYVTETRQSELF